MRKVLSYLFILIGLGLLVLSTSDVLMGRVMRWRYTRPGWLGVHQAGEAGDLVTMAYLDKEPRFFAPYDLQFTKAPDTGRRNIDLYVWGDSYVMHVPDSAWSHLHAYHFGRRDYHDLEYRLDHRQKNILIIENGERFIRLYLRHFDIFNHLRSEGAGGVTAAVAKAGEMRTAGIGLKASLFFNPSINQNLEFNLFSYNFFNPVRLCKAEMTYRLFGRASGDVALSEDGQRLFLKQTVLPHNPMSCYEPIAGSELSRIDGTIDSIYTHYRKEGFDEVYFSFIPNPASLLQPAYYNGLLPVLQQHALQKGIPVIDVYTPFAAMPDPSRLYRQGDTHWNNEGLQVWVQLVNKELNRLSRQR